MVPVLPAEEAHQIISSLIAVALGRPARGEESWNEAWLERVYDPRAVERACPLPEPHAVRSLSPSPEAQLVSRLTALAGCGTSGDISHSARTRAREIVYDAANCSLATAFGPFVRMARGHKGGLEVDWRVVQALQDVMQANVEEEITVGWGDGDVQKPRGWGSTRMGGAREGRMGGNRHDWAGVEDGVWRGTYAFRQLQCPAGRGSVRGLRLRGC